VQRLGYGLIAFLGAQLKSGIDLILEANNFETKLIGVDLIITGEGKIDNQTLNGKVVAGVIKKAKEKNIPVYGICGICTLTENQTIKLGIKKVIQIKTPEMEINYAIENAKDLLIKNTINLLENI
jgi:glycerate 2-kinase